MKHTNEVHKAPVVPIVPKAAPKAEPAAVVVAIPVVVPANPRARDVHAEFEAAKALLVTEGNKPTSTRMAALREDCDRLQILCALFDNAKK